ncbi:hypothetical protein MTO96_025817 [Rhipicephalus appendiculatus]
MPAARTTFKEERLRGLCRAVLPERCWCLAISVLAAQPRRGQATMHEEEKTGLEDVEDDDSGRERRHLMHGAECAGRAGRGCGESFSST